MLRKEITQLLSFMLALPVITNAQAPGQIFIIDPNASYNQKVQYSFGDDSEEEATPAFTVKKISGRVSDSEYLFKQTSTPFQLEPYTTTVYASSPHRVANLRDHVMCSSKDSIQYFALNPAGTAYVVVTQNKKGKSSLSQYSTGAVDKKIASYDVKKYGEPIAATYSADGRRLTVATQEGLRTFDARKMLPLGDINPWKAGFEPTHIIKMVSSPNDFFVAVTNGETVHVYNMKDKVLRMGQILEVPVSDISFSPDGTVFGVLTDDGLLAMFDTRSFKIDKFIDDLGEGKAFAYNSNGKYIGVVTTDNIVELVNLVKPTDRRRFSLAEGGINDVAIIMDASEKPILSFGGVNAIHAYRLHDLEPYYSKLISDEVEMKMIEWMKMQPGESLDAYRERVNDESRLRQRRLFEDEISTRLAGENNITMTAMSLGNYNRDQEVLAISFDNMPTIYLPVPSKDIQSFHDASDLVMSDAQYGVLPDDSFELIYAKFTNRNDGKIYIYDNLERVPMTFMNDDNTVSLEVLQQQQMEELKLQEIKEQVLAVARHDNVISENTNITVDSSVVPDYDANGNKILNYNVKFTYEVSPGFSAVEDFGPGLYHVEDSGAAQSMLEIVKQAFEGDFAQYVTPGSRLLVHISGTADATPIVHGIPYDGAYGEFEEEPIYQNGELTGISVTKAVV